MSNTLECSAEMLEGEVTSRASVVMVGYWDVGNGFVEGSRTVARTW